MTKCRKMLEWKPALGWMVSRSSDSMEVEPSATTLPVVRARSSAFFMAPKSGRKPSATNSTIRMVRIPYS